MKPTNDRISRSLWKVLFDKTKRRNSYKRCDLSLLIAKEKLQKAGKVEKAGGCVMDFLAK